MLSEQFIWLGAAVMLLAALGYVAATVRGQARPNRVSWGLWSVTSWLAFAGQLDEGVGMPALLTFTVALVPSLIFLASFVGGAYWQFSRLDIVCAVLAVLTLVAWQITASGIVAIVLSIAVDAIAGIPTIVKACRDPESESHVAYTAGMFSAACTLLTLTEFTIANSAFAFYFLILCATISFLLLVTPRLRRRALRNSLHFPMVDQPHRRLPPVQLRDPFAPVAPLPLPALPPHPPVPVGRAVHLARTGRTALLDAARPERLPQVDVEVRVRVGGPTAEVGLPRVVTGETVPHRSGSGPGGPRITVPSPRAPMTAVSAAEDAPRSISGSAEPAAVPGSPGGGDGSAPTASVVDGPSTGGPAATPPRTTPAPRPAPVRLPVHTGPLHPSRARTGGAAHPGTAATTGRIPPHPTESAANVRPGAGVEPDQHPSGAVPPQRTPSQPFAGRPDAPSWSATAGPVMEDRPRYDGPRFPDRGYGSAYGSGYGSAYDNNNGYDHGYAGHGADHPGDRGYPPPGPPPLFGPPNPPAPPLPVPGAGARRRRLPLVIGAVAVVAALGALAVLLVDVRQVPPPVATAAAPAPEFPRPLPVVPPPAPDPAVAASIAVPMVRGTLPVGPTPGYLEIAPNGRFALIAHREAGVVSVFDTTINRVSATIAIPAGPPRFVSFSPDSRRAYISIYNEERTINLVGVLDTTTNTLLGTVPVGRRPFASAVSPDGARLWVPSHDDGRLDIIDTATDTLLTSVPVAPNPHWVAFADDGTRVYVANHESNVVTVVDSTTLVPLTTIPVGTSPHSTAVSVGHGQAAVVNYDSSTVSMIDTASGAVTAEVAVGRNPQDVNYAPDGRYLYTANVDEDTVSVVDTAAPGVTATIPVCDGPTSVSPHPGGRLAYVTCLNTGEVMVLDTTADQ